MGFNGLSKLTGGKMAEPKVKEEVKPTVAEHDEKPLLTVHDHGDGSFHTESGSGERTEHPDHLHLTTHIAHHVAPESGHFHSSHDGFEHSSHAVVDGQHDETRQHENLDGVHQHLDETMGEGGESAKSAKQSRVDDAEDYGSPLGAA